MGVNNSKKFSSMRPFLRDLQYSIKNYQNIIRLKMRFRNANIRDPHQIAFSNLNNISLGDGVFIDCKATIRIMDTCKLYIGDGADIGPYCHLGGTKNSIIIGKNVLFAPMVFVSTTNYNYEDISKPIKDQGYSSKGNVVIGEGSWLGIGVSVLSGVKIGKNSVIGANSVVTDNIPSYSIAVGSPCKVVKKITDL